MSIAPAQATPASSIHHRFSGRATQTIARAVKASAGKSLSGKFRKPPRIRPGSRRAAGDAETPQRNRGHPSSARRSASTITITAKTRALNSFAVGGERPVEPVGDPAKPIVDRRQQVPARGTFEIQQREVAVSTEGLREIPVITRVVVERLPALQYATVSMPASASANASGATRRVETLGRRIVAGPEATAWAVSLVLPSRLAGVPPIDTPAMLIGNQASQARRCLAGPHTGPRAADPASNR